MRIIKGIRALPEERIHERELSRFGRIGMP